MKRLSNPNRGDRSAEGQSYYRRNRETVLAKQKALRLNRPERFRNRRNRAEYSQEYYQRTRPTRLAVASAWYLKNKERHKQSRQNRKSELREWWRAYYTKNRAALNEKAKAWSKNNRAKVRSYAARKMITCPEFRLARRLRSRIRCALIRSGGEKAFKSTDLLGCSIKEARDYIQSLFTRGMDWGAFMAGKIHIDHKRPVAAFDLTNPKEQRKCFSIFNLQPLWASENLAKSDKYTDIQPA